MSGVELNALMTQVAETGNLPPAFQQQVAAAGGASKPYNRELWRIQNGMLEKALVNFVVEKSRFKKASAIGLNCKNCTKFAENFNKWGKIFSGHFHFRLPLWRFLEPKFCSLLLIAVLSNYETVFCTLLAKVGQNFWRKNGFPDSPIFDRKHRFKT